ncbi:uncharacterized protein PG986_011351 [Apiospora aurea]|uniref:Uncharacterized protein n=1 Tax=Apiospora aurea TaxID=335848 RepID=A0ABR1Q4W5_9PEZI
MRIRISDRAAQTQREVIKLPALYDGIGEFHKDFKVRGPVFCVIGHDDTRIPSASREFNLTLSQRAPYHVREPRASRWAGTGLPDTNNGLRVVLQEVVTMIVTVVVEPERRARFAGRRRRLGAAAAELSVPLVGQHQAVEPKCAQRLCPSPTGAEHG